jgi:hypothetical protein
LTAEPKARAVQHPSSLGGGWPYAPSLPDDSGASDPDPEADMDTLLRKDSMVEGTSSLCLKDAGGGSGSGSGSGSAHQFETPESSVHQVPMPWTTTDAPNSDSLAGSVVEGNGSRSGR